MRMVIILPDTADRGILIGIGQKRLQREIDGLIRKGEREEAMVHAVMRGVIEDEFHVSDMPDLPIDCILSRERACWEHRR